MQPPSKQYGPSSKKSSKRFTFGFEPKEEGILPVEKKEPRVFVNQVAEDSESNSVSEISRNSFSGAIGSSSSADPGSNKLFMKPFSFAARNTQQLPSPQVILPQYSRRSKESRRQSKVNGSFRIDQTSSRGSSDKKPELLAISPQACVLKKKRMSTVIEASSLPLIEPRKNRKKMSMPITDPFTAQNESQLYSEALKIYQAEIEELKRKLQMRTIFQNMLIHDMRSPTTSTKEALLFVCKLFQESDDFDAELQKLLAGNSDQAASALDFGGRVSDMDKVTSTIQEVARLVGKALSSPQAKGYPRFRDSAADVDWDNEFADFADGIEDEEVAQLQTSRKVCPSRERKMNNLESSTNVVFTEPAREEVVLQIDRGIQCNLGSDFEGESPLELEYEIRNLKSTLSKVQELMEDCIAPQFESMKNSMINQSKINSKKMSNYADLISLQLETQREMRSQAESLLTKQLFSQQMMGSLINELMDLAKLENNSFRFDEEYFSLQEVIQQALTMVASQAQSRGVALHATVDEKTTLRYTGKMFGDKHRYTQILVNFLTNAIKFTEEGGTVTVEMKLRSAYCSIPKRPINKQFLEEMISKKNLDISSEHLKSMIISSNEVRIDKVRRSTTKSFFWLQLSIADNGCGISQEGVGKLFLDFGKLDENSSKNRQGTGLGLSICKKLIEQMGGDIEVDSKLGVGTKFTINIKTDSKVLKDIKLKVAQEMLEAQAELDSLLLMMSSKVKKSALLTRLIEKPSSADPSKSGGDEPPKPEGKALSRAKKLFGAIEKYNLLEANKPLLQGPASEMEVELKQIDIKLALSEHLSKHFKSSRKSLKKGSLMNGGSDIIEVLKKGTGHSGNANSEDSIFSEESKMSETLTRPYSVLVANDEPLQLQILEILFSTQNFKVTCAENGREAFQAVKDTFTAEGEKTRFDLIILDLNMPISDGYEACKLIKKLYSGQTIFTEPISPDKSMRGYNLGLSTRKTKMPLICANTSFISDEDLKKTQEVGFDMCFIQLRALDITEQLLPLLDERRQQQCYNSKILGLIESDDGSSASNSVSQQSLDSNQTFEQNSRAGLFGLMNEIMEDEEEGSDNTSEPGDIRERGAGDHAQQGTFKKVEINVNQL